MTRSETDRPNLAAARGSGTADGKTTARGAAGEALDDAARAARDSAKSQVACACDSVAGKVGTVAQTLRSAAGEMRRRSAQERAIAPIAGGRADASAAIRQKDLGEAARDRSDFASRNPLVSLGGAALAGSAATRFARAPPSREAVVPWVARLPTTAARRRADWRYIAALQVPGRRRDLDFSGGCR